jgi:hypothetical protein
MPTQQLTDASTTTGQNRQQIMADRSAQNRNQATLFNSTGGDGGYTCPTTESNAGQNKVMANVCQNNANAMNVNNGTQKAGKLKRRKTKRKKTKRRKMKKKSKRRK